MSMINGLGRANYTINNMHQTKAVQKKTAEMLASGKKINRAADNAAGLAIAQKMQSQIKYLDASSENYSRKIDSNRIAEGALSHIGETYNDMYANSIRAMNGTMGAADKLALKQANRALGVTAEHIANTTKYNEDYVLDDINASFDVMSADAISEASVSAVSTRAKLGAEENGLAHAVSISEITAENTTAAMSRVEDTEIEKASSQNQANKLLGQVQTAMLKNQMTFAEGIVTILPR